MNEIEDIISKVEGWINDEYQSKIKVTIDEDYHPDHQPFLLKMICSDILGEELPVSVFKPRQYKNKIGIYSGIKFDDQEQKSFNALNAEFKDKIISELYNSLAIMGFTPISLHDIHSLWDWK